MLSANGSVRWSVRELGVGTKKQGRNSVAVIRNSVAVILHINSGRLGTVWSTSCLSLYLCGGAYVPSAGG
jgi:hypothetical protein